MTKQQLLHASKLLMELADLFRVASEQQDGETPVVDVIQPLVEVVEPEVAETIEVEADEEQIEDLSSMTIQQLRSLAKSNGLSTKGTKKDLITRINEASEPVEEEIVEEEIEETVEEVAPEVEEVVEDVEEIIEDEEDAEEEIEESTEDMDEMELIQSELEAMDVDELVEILESVELPTKGKKQALISRIMEAVVDGLLEFESDEIEEYDADEDAELDEAIEQALEEDTDTSDDVEEEEIEVEEENEEEELSPREATQIEVEEEILEAYENGDLTDKEIANFLEDYFNGKFKPINKKRALNKYIEIQCDLVDADGDRMPMGEPYYVSDEDVFCCGSEIKELDNGNLFCEVCGQEYETE